MCFAPGGDRIASLKPISSANGARVALSAAEARRIALAAQGFGRPAPPRRADRRHVRRIIDRLGCLQIDSVNVLVRAHYLPVYSRVGSYRNSLLDAMTYDDRELFEYLGHEASLLPVTLYPLLRWRMDRAAAGDAWRPLVRFAAARAEYIEEVYAEVATRGPLAAGELAAPGARGGTWWGWGDGKRALEWLYWTGRLAVSARRRFERLYDLPARVLPSSALAAPVPPVEEAQRRLLEMAARALGIATAGDLADYFRLRLGEARPRLAELVDAGRLLPATVEGWSQPAFLDAAADLPRRVDGAALLSPFDSLLWERGRTERVFGFHLRLELYTPASRRRFGYYVLPFLLGDRLVARVDLKAARRDGTLVVRGAFAEPGVSPARVAEPLGRALEELAGWLHLDRVRVGRRGDLAAALRGRAATAIAVAANGRRP